MQRRKRGEKVTRTLIADEIARNRENDARDEIWWGNWRGKKMSRWYFYSSFHWKQDQVVNYVSSSDFFIFYKFHLFTLLIAPSSSSLLPPPRPLFLLAPYSSLSLIPPSSLFLLTPCPSFILVQHCLNHLESVKVDFSSILTKASRTEGRTDGPTYRRTCPLIEMQTLIKRIILNKRKQINFTF